MKNKLLDETISKKNVNGWTLERRKRQSKLIKEWQPWKRLTGAKTIEGKSKVSQNAYKGAYGKELSMLKKRTNEMLKKQKEWINQL